MTFLGVSVDSPPILVSPLAIDSVVKANKTGSGGPSVFGCGATATVAARGGGGGAEAPARCARGCNGAGRLLRGNWTADWGNATVGGCCCHQKYASAEQKLNSMINAIERVWEDIRTRSRQGRASRRRSGRRHHRPATQDRGIGRIELREFLAQGVAQGLEFR